MASTVVLPILPEMMRTGMRYDIASDGWRVTVDGEDKGISQIGPAELMMLTRKPVAEALWDIYGHKECSAATGAT
jgi:hypothetical protein